MKTDFQDVEINIRTTHLTGVKVQCYLSAIVFEINHHFLLALASIFLVLPLWFFFEAMNFYFHHNFATHPKRLFIHSK